MFRAFSAVAVSAFLLSSCGPPDSTPPASAPAAPAAPETPAPDANALTAEGYGPLRIGMTRAEVVAALGDDSNPGAVGGAEPETCDEWRPVRAPEGLRVMILDGALGRITLSGPSTLKTDRGFGIGDTATAIKLAYGTAALSQPHKYAEAPAEDIFVWATGGPAGEAYVENPAARGVRYEINGEGKVQMIHVGGPAIQLVEGCS
jgi:hypothetical protein